VGASFSPEIVERIEALLDQGLIRAGRGRR
jgi:hypothetical protein